MEHQRRHRALSLIAAMSRSNIIHFTPDVEFSRTEKRRKGDLLLKIQTLSLSTLETIVGLSIASTELTFEDGTPIYEDLRRFTMVELIKACDSCNPRLNAADKETKDNIIEKIIKCPTETRQEVREKLNRYRNKRSREVSPERREIRIHSTEALDGEFLKSVPKEICNERISRFISRTDNESLQMDICGVCAREKSVHAVETLLLDDVPNIHLLRPETPHHAHDHSHGFLLHKPRTRSGAPVAVPEDIQQANVVVCNDCMRDLKKNKLPLFSLANGMWIGDIPHELAVLSLPERVLVARFFPAAHVVKLYPKRKNAKYWNTERLNSGVKGNVSTYWLDPDSISDMIQGDIMPPDSRILAATIGVTIVGPQNLPERTLPGFLRVRRGRVDSALKWLKHNNPLYADITISEGRLNQLPEDDIPREIISTARFSADTSKLETERSGYVASGDDESEDEPNENDVRYAETAQRHNDGVEVIYNDLVDVAGEISRDVHGECEGPGVFTLQSLGVVDVTGASIPDQDILAHALANASNSQRSKGFAVKRGGAFVNEYARRDEETGDFTDGGTTNPNHMYGAFPVLFPYAKGGPDTMRPRKVPYEAHIRWSLEYQDRRFRKDLHFIFQAFGVIQKRQVCRSAELQINKAAYKRNEAAIRRLKPADLVEAANEEKRNAPILNPAVRSLRELVSGLRVKVPGTDESRTGMRSQIWGLITMKNPPSLWITINPSDTHDPIAQVLAGEDINLDSFMATAGPDVSRRASNIAGDPFAAAKFFHLTIKAVLEELFGITAHKESPKIFREDGIFGRVEGYIGSVEAQGRGTLHLHIIIWLTGAPTASKMKTLLHSDVFRKRVRNFLEANIRANVENAGPEAVKSFPKDSQVSYSRPINPSVNNYAAKACEAEKRLANNVQHHKCKQKACLNLIKGQWVCKRRAPFELSSSDYVNVDGSWGVKRAFQFFNSWCPAILQCIRSNHDIKLITNGGETKDITWYITNYATKKQRHSSNTSALIAKRLAYHVVEEKWNTDSRAVNKRLLARCANTLTRDHEFSGPEVASYLMGWGDRYISHHFTTIYWSAVVFALKRYFPELRKKRYIIDFPSGETSSDVYGNEFVPGEDNTETEDVVLEQVDGQLELRDQLKDYVERGVELENSNFLEFLLNTYAEKSSSMSPVNQRVRYIQGSGREEKCRVVRTIGHETMPNFVGKWFPRNDDSTEYPFYCASMLALLNPWRKMEDIKGHNFKDSFDNWKMNCTESNKNIMENIQYYHESSDGSRKKRGDNYGAINHTTIDVQNDEDILMSDALLPVLTEEDVEIARDNSVASREMIHGRLAMSIAQNVGIFDGDLVPCPRKEAAKVATYDDMKNFAAWEKDIQNLAKKNPDRKLVDESVTLSQSVSTADEPGVQPLAGKSINQPLDASYLNNEQSRAYQIILQHLTATLNKKKPPQLLMTVIGPGGTGKTALINELTRLFDSMDARGILAKTATSGVAATLIAGTTLHFWGGLPMIAPKSDGWMETPSKIIKQRREKNVLLSEYVIIDEVSMATSELHAMASGVASHVKKDTADPTKCFGGLNVILLGDFHQFPPPGRPDLALYNNRPPNQNATIGRAIYLQFETVVVLREQMRIRDRVWMEILQRSRVGECTAEDIKEIRKLVLTETRCDIPDFTREPWSSATLVTPRHGVRNPWNEAAIDKHCVQTGQHKYIFDAEDTIGNDREELSIAQRIAVAGLTEKKTARLPGRITLAIGMKAMVTWNIATDADLANGARGEIVDIILDPREPKPNVEDVGPTVLNYPPAMVLFKPLSDVSHHLKGLPKGLIPIFPCEGKFTATMHDGKKKTITRRQLAITASYAFTDYRSQGQTIEYAIVDIGRTPTGKLSPFSAYVALSRSRGRSTIRLLRDFDDGLFTNHPSEDLREEDARLEDLDSETKDRFEAGYFSAWNL